MSLDGYIDSLKSDGRFDSVGAFSLDQARALQKLRRYQISDPADFSAALVASAVASGAQWIQMETPYGGFRLEHNGRSIPHHQLVTLFSSLLVTGPDQDLAPVQELAYGLNAILRLKPKKIRVTCSGLEEVVVLDLDSQQLVVKRADPYETYGDSVRTVIQVDGLWRNLKHRLVRGLGRRPELEVLHRRCSFLEIPVFCQGQRLEFKSNIPTAQVVARIGDPPELPFRWSAHILEVSGESPAWIGFGSDVPSQITVVSHGVCLSIFEEELPEGIHAIVYSAELRKDLSRAGLVNDAIYQALLKQLKTTSWDMLVNVSGNKDRYPYEFRRAVLRSLETEAKRAKERWDSDLNERLSKACERLKN